MILKKPYAFLIKHFRVIHLVLAALMAYLAYKSYKIVSFFGDFASSGYFSTLSNIAGSYVNLFMYLIVIVILVAAVFIFMLMNQKKKSTKYYVFTIGYYFLLFILFSVTFGIMQDLERASVSIQTARVYRDLSLILSLPQYFFVIYTFLRGCGFNLKKFNFQLDLKEMDITASDNEEIELTVGVETYKAKRTIRRFIREFKYYILENTFIFICIISIVGVIIATGLFLNINVYNKVYKEGQSFSYQNFTLTINESYLTSKGYKGNELIDGKTFLVMDVNVVNKSSSSTELKLSDFRLKINNENIYPSKNKIDYFKDIATPYKSDKLKGGSEGNYVIAFELENEYVRDSFVLKVFDSANYNAGAIKTNYKDVKLTPQKVDNIVTVGTYQQQEKIELKDSILKNSNLTIDSYNITNIYKYNYEFCVTSDCQQSTGIVTPNYMISANSTLLVLDYTLNLDKNSNFYKNVRSETSVFNSFCFIRYTKNGKSEVLNTYDLTPDNLQNKVVLQVDSKIRNADKVELLVRIRNKEYSVIIKEKKS